MKKFILPVIFFFLFYPLGPARGAMSSTNYYIYADAVGVNGGDYSSSASYGLQGTAGEASNGITNSATYELRGGYQAAELGAISISVSSSSLDLGVLNIAAVNSGRTEVTVGAEASTGYTLSVGSAAGTMPTAVADGAVTAGQDEYGVAVSGADAAFAGDAGVAANLILASSPSFISHSVTTLTFKASRSSASPVGAYSQAIVLTVVANF